MEDAERIQAIGKACRAYRYPETLVAAVVEYLSGQGSLEQVRQEWQSDNKRHHPYPLFAHIPRQEHPLDQLDQRLIDIAGVIGQLPWLFQAIGWQGPVEAMRDYLLSQSMSEQRVLEYAAQAVIGTAYSYYAASPPRTAPLTRLLAAYLPTHYAQMQPLFQANPRSQLAFISLLLQAQPPDLDLVERLVEALQEEKSMYSSILGLCARLLLQADPARFTEWARKIAGDSGATYNSRSIALLALLARDPAQHMDLVIKAVRTPPANTGWWAAHSQCDVLKAAYKADPARYQSLVEEATLSPSRHLATTAVNLLAAGAIDPVAATLKRCVEQGPSDAALRAAQALFKQPWEGQQDYAVAQLANRSKRLRAFAGGWLAKQGEASIDGIAPYLSHRSADIRLSAVQTLLPIGGERATALLFSRLDIEKSQQIRQAIIDGIGLPGFAGPEAASRALTIQRLTAKSKQHHHYLPRPFLAWFDLDDAPALHWTAEGAMVPAQVLDYLLYRQSHTTDAQKLHPEVEQALTLIEINSAGPLALALYRGWLNDGAKGKHANLLPLISALADDRLVPHLRRQIEEWGPTNRRKLAASLLRVLAQMESAAARAEIQSFTKLFKRGYMRRATKAALDLAAAS